MEWSALAAIVEDMGNEWLGYLWAILPTIVVLALFYLVLRGAIRSDRAERKAYDQIEAEERAKRGMPVKKDHT